MNNPKISIVVIYKRDDERINDFLSVIQTQTYNNTEIVCAAYGLGNSNITISDNSTVKLLNFPENEDVESVKKSVSELLTGDYICFLSLDTPIDENYLQKLYLENKKNNFNNLEFELNKLYKHSFLENKSFIQEIIENICTTSFEKFNNKVEELKNNQKEELNKCYSDCENKINNKVYDLSVKFNLLEKNLYDYENQTEEYKNSIDEKIMNAIKENNQYVYSDISKVYDFINSEMGKKHDEINRVYEEITNNYKYTEKLVDEAKQYFKSEINQFYKKTDDLKNEQKIMYDSLKNLLEVNYTELNDKIEAAKNYDNIANIDSIKDFRQVERDVKSNFDTLYQKINEYNSRFYEELSNLYKEVDEKIKKQRN